MTRRVRRVRSTGAEPTPAAPVSTQAVTGEPESTGAEPFDGEPVTTRVSHLDDPVVVQNPTPGPVTMTVGWIADTDPASGTDGEPSAEAVMDTKVIEPAEQPGPEPARTRAQTKTSRSRGRAGDR